jgi:hypothetical protein
MDKGRMRKLPVVVRQRVKIIICDSSLTECHDQAGVGSEVNDLLNALSGRSIEPDEDSKDRTETTNKDEREDGEPAAAYQNSQLPPLGVVERIVRIAGGNGNPSNLSSSVDELEITIRRLLSRKALFRHFHMVCHHGPLCMI